MVKKQILAEKCDTGIVSVGTKVWENTMIYLRCLVANRPLLVLTLLAVGFWAWVIRLTVYGGDSGPHQIFFYTTLYGALWLTLISGLLLKWTLEFHQKYSKKIRGRPDRRVCAPLDQGATCRTTAHRIALGDHGRGSPNHPC